MPAVRAEGFAAAARAGVDSDGFALAEVDLGLRGEGELIGTRQHGLAQYRVAELPRDAELLERARLYAERIIDEDPSWRIPTTSCSPMR